MSDSETPKPRRISNQLMPQVYDELRALAAAYLRRERKDHTLEPSALVHEAYLKLSQQPRLNVADRTHFFALAAGAMRQILVDHARAQNSLKRGGSWERITVSESLSDSGNGSESLLALDDALARLAVHDEQVARIVEMRFFAGLTEVEIAGEIGRSERWVRKQWAFARAWLRRDMGRA